MAQDKRQFCRGCPAFDFIQFGVTNAAGGNFNQNFSRCAGGLRQFSHFQGVIVFSYIGQGL
jgi:hypothetical protein